MAILSRHPKRVAALFIEEDEPGQYVNVIDGPEQ